MKSNTQKCYKFNFESIQPNYYTCDKYGHTYLISIESQEENEELQGVMQNFGINGAWIGLSNEWNDTWHNEKPIKYKNFGTNCTDTEGLGKSYYIRTDGKWRNCNRDIMATGSYGYFCGATYGGVQTCPKTFLPTAYQYRSSQNSCLIYYVSDYKVSPPDYYNYFDATTCPSFDGSSVYFPSIQNAFQNNELVSFAQHHYGKCGEYYFIGMEYTGSSGGSGCNPGAWIWSNGDNSNYTNWAAGYPQDTQGCTEAVIATLSANKGQWQNNIWACENCGEACFICQVDLPMRIV
uniref:C-type lectin domain-containing protein n=1 Tax=Acrobeloides nanus TaxID=290746 RepID=A0A914DTQ4_9BILA